MIVSTLACKVPDEFLKNPCVRIRQGHRARSPRSEHRLFPICGVRTPFQRLLSFFPRDLLHIFLNVYIFEVGSRCVVLAGLELTEISPASASQVLRHTWYKIH